MIWAFIFIVGLCLGSFFNVLLARLPQGQHILGRSHCNNCLRTLTWWELFPVISFIALKGNCRTCHSSIGLRYPFVELITGLLLVTLAWQQGIEFFFIEPFLSILCLLFILLGLFDYFYLILPDNILLPGIGIGLWYALQAPTAWNFINSALLFIAFFATIYMVSHGKWLGFGDVKLVGLIGLILGYPLGFMALLLAIWIGAAIGILMLLTGSATRKTELPFGTFLCLSTIVIIIWQPFFISLGRLLI